MSPATFAAAVSRGMAASPFRSDLTFIFGTTRYLVKNCIVSSGDNKAKSDEYGTEHTRSLRCHVPKKNPDRTATLPRQPAVDLDAVEHLGRKYNLVSITGFDDHSPAWVIEAAAPL
jgi:hypothetical protein